MPKPLNSPPKQLGSNVTPTDIYGTYSGGRGPGTMGGSAIGGHVGGVDPEPVEKLPDTSVSSVSVERSRYNISSKIDPLPWLTPDYLVQAHMTARRGFLQRAAICWHDMAATDGKLLALIGKRCASVTRYGWEIVCDPGHEKDAKAARHKNVLEKFYGQLTATNALDRNITGGVKLAAQQVMLALAYGYSVQEIIWRPDGGEGLSAELRYIPLWFFENTTGRLRFLESDWHLYGTDCPAGEWLIAANDNLMRACAPLWLFKHKALQFWLIYCEKFGTPGLHAETSAQKDSEDWLAIEDAVRKFGQEWGIVTAPGTKITPVDVSARGEMAYPKLIEWVDKELATLWRGGDLSTQSHHGGGQGQGASLQGQELAGMEQADSAWVSDVMHEQLDRYAVRYATGDAVPLASIRFKTAPMKDTANDLLIDQFLLSNGFPISVEEAAQRYEREIPDAGEELLKPAVQADAEEVGKVTGGVEGKGAGNERAPVNRMIFAANEAPAAANATRPGDHPALAPMLAKARVRLANAERDALKPLAARLQELYQAAVNQSPAEFAAALNTFRKHELPALAKKVMGHGDTEQIFAEAIAAALVTGLTEKNRSKA